MRGLSNSFPQVLRGLINTRVEETLSLWLIVLAIGLWVAISLGWVGSPTWIWVGGAALLSVGHAFGWFLRRWKSAVRSGVVGLAVLGTLALVPRTVGPALAGDLLPVAHFLLLFQAIASFELRTRAGMYASIGMSGGIFFFVSQLALDLAFGVFLTGFTTLVLSFLAMSFLSDQTRQAEVRWFRSRFAFAWFWTGVFMASLAAATGVFLLLPKGFGDPVNGAQAVALPVRAGGAAGGTEAVPDFESLVSALPLSQSGIDPSGGPRTDAWELVRKPNDDGPGAGVSKEDGIASSGRVPTVGEETDLLALQGDGALRHDPVVMRVRSPALTYWRGQVFDAFDGQSWHPDPESWNIRSRAAGGSVYSAPDYTYDPEGPLYTQVYFLDQQTPPGTLFTGYAPIVATVASARGEEWPLRDGTTYRVLATVPDFSEENLAGADPAGEVDPRYQRISSSLERLRPVAEQITRGAHTDLERMRRIVNYMDTITSSTPMLLTSWPRLHLLWSFSHSAPPGAAWTSPRRRCYSPAPPASRPGWRPATCLDAWILFRGPTWSVPATGMRGPRRTWAGPAGCPSTAHPGRRPLRSGREEPTEVRQ